MDEDRPRIVGDLCLLQSEKIAAAMRSGRLNCTAC
ncbi:hypothetical protein LPU83_pLPU83c_0103 (plasmid) [Rhizobium favelukesii]|uniref:Uncharacterized protein n=1 Tax=Rhizobium favelukesii TaxID=348824 RepID=W6RK20_9HYPH|nr:hypothetical protein LPU83_pLPU83c_0103 [Rhizobium favelukesii]